MELAVIWGNFSCSELACSDLACSDLAHSNLAHFFLSKFLLFSCNIHKLGNSFSTHPNRINLTKWNFYTLFHNNIHISTKRAAQYPFIKFSMKMTFSLNLAPPKNHIKIFKNQKLNATSQTPIQHTTFHQYTSFTKYLYFLRYGDISTFTPHFSVLPNLTFLTSETHKLKFDKFLPGALSPTQNEPKEPKRSQINPHLDHETAVHILLEDAAFRCFDLAHTDLAHLSPNRATHLKSPENFKKRSENSQQINEKTVSNSENQVWRNGSKRSGGGPRLQISISRQFRWMYPFTSRGATEHW